MTTRGRVYGIDSHPTPPPDPPGEAIYHRAERDIIDELARANINLAAKNYNLSTGDAVHKLRIAELEDALQGILTAIDNEGFGFTEALRRARVVMRG